MIIIEDDRIYCLWCRTNRRVKWRYSTWGGRYKTIEAARLQVKERYTEKVEYLIEDMDGNQAETGFINA